MEVYEVDDGYVPTQAVLEVLEWFDNNDKELKASGHIVDELWDSVIPKNSFSDETEQAREDQEAYEERERVREQLDSDPNDHTIGINQ